MKSSIQMICLTVLMAVGGQMQAGIITSPLGFSGPTQVIDYLNSPLGTIAGGTSITTQYALFGVLHDGSTTTPPGPPGMSSTSGLPGLESPAGDLDPNVPISMSFSVPVREVGAFFLMGLPSDSITLSAFRADASLIESQTIVPASMPLRPGPFGFNEGFIGLTLSEKAASVRFSPTSLASTAFVIDDLRFGTGASVVPEPASLAIWSSGALGLSFVARRRNSTTTSTR